MPLYALWQYSGVCSLTSTFIIQFDKEIAVSPWNKQCEDYVLDLRAQMNKGSYVAFVRFGVRSDNLLPQQN